MVIWSNYQEHGTCSLLGQKVLAGGQCAAGTPCVAAAPNRRAPNLSLQLPIAGLDRERGLAGTHSVQLQHCSILLIQLGCLAK
jgi:hypothetical protein